METKASYTLIGFFTLAVLLGVFGFVYWFQNLGGAAERVPYRVVFDGSVSGLRTGAAVLFNGIRIGEVSDLKLAPGNNQRVIATMSVDKSAPLREDTKIGLEFQGLTGIAAIALSGGTFSKPALTGTKENPPTLVADPNATQDVTQAARDVLKRVDKLISDNEKVLHETLANIEVFSQTLARNSERIDSILTNIDTVSGNLDKRIAEITSGVNRFTASGSREIEALSGDARRALSELDRTLRNFDRNPSRVLFGGQSQNVPVYNGGSNR
jgi:phospholipid/cholesterol/gamma-HCH transport system substrate-binding protein